MDIFNAKNYKNLIVWQRSKDLVLKIYHILKTFPKEELYGLVTQMKRSAISIASNIAEGNQRRTKKDKIRFLNIAHASLVELDCQLKIALELNFLTNKDYKEALELINKTSFLLTRFIQSEMDQQ
ncbi:four helix bundle protein [Patescibacteria group bacterium]|nr:four helix bundle protein [Patescibacteria group bacterium]